jgi:hypothetical protein
MIDKGFPQHLIIVLKIVYLYTNIAEGKEKICKKKNQ